MPIHWIDTIEELGQSALTAEAQTAPLPENEVLLGDDLFPRQDVESVKAGGVLVREIREVTEAREWNAPGVQISKPPLESFAMNILPIEGRDPIGEYEQQILAELGQVAGTEAMRAKMRVDGPRRVRDLALANLRALELKRYDSWLLGLIRQKNPQNRAQEIIAEFPWRASRIETAGTAWSNPGVNAYNEFIAWAKEGVEELGPLEGAMLRQALLDVIRADAPLLANGKKMNIDELEAEIRTELGIEFRFLINRSWVGTKANKTFLHPVSRVGLVPAGGAVGVSLFAPVQRAIEANAELEDGDDELDVRGQGAFVEISNGGKYLEFQVQLNAAPMPEEGNIWVNDTGVIG